MDNLPNNYYFIQLQILVLIYDKYYRKNINSPPLLRETISQISL